MMTMRPVHRLPVALISIALAATLFSPPPIRASAQTAGSASRAPIVVIIGNQTGITEMSNALLRRVFRGDPTELNGRRLTPFNHAPESPLRRHFDLLALGMSTGEVGRYWIDRRIRGQGLPPRTVPSQAIARAVVARLPGAIAYITANELDASVRGLRIDGKSHGDRDYPLQGAP
jgi:hypothetical protein